MNLNRFHKSKIPLHRSTRRSPEYNKEWKLSMTQQRNNNVHLLYLNNIPSHQPILKG